MTSKGKIILLSSIATVAAIAPAAVLAFNISKQKHDNDVIAQAKKFKFMINPEAMQPSGEPAKLEDGTIVATPNVKYNKATHYASEYAYASYSVYYTDYKQLEPALISNSKFWDGIIYKYPSQLNKTFYLANEKRDLSLQDFENDYYFYFHSYANDFDGKLYLRVYFEKKTKDLSSKAVTTEEVRKRKPSWEFVDYVMDGFKKRDINNADFQTNLLKQYNPGFHKFNMHNSIRYLFWKGDFDLKNGYKKLDDLLVNSYDQLKSNDKLPTVKGENKEQIEAAHSAFNSVFWITETVSMNDEHSSKFSIDKTKPIWVTKEAGSNDKLIFHYYIKSFISDAKYNDKDSLNQSKEIQIKEEQTYEYHFDYYKLKELGKFIKVVPVPGVELNTIKVSDLIFNSWSTTSDIHVNTKGGYFNNLNIILNTEDPDYPKNLSFNPAVKFYTISNANSEVFNNTTYKPEAATFGKPIVISDPKAGKATFVYTIENANDSNKQYVGFYELSGFKPE